MDYPQNSIINHDGVEHHVGMQRGRNINDEHVDQRHQRQQRQQSSYVDHRIGGVDNITLINKMVSTIPSDIEPKREVNDDGIHGSDIMDATAFLFDPSIIPTNGNGIHGRSTYHHHGAHSNEASVDAGEWPINDTPPYLL